MDYNYVQNVETRLRVHLPWLDPDLARLYALLVLVKGEEVTLADVHDAWSLWQNWIDPDHRSIVSFGELSPGVRELDRPCAEAIAETAREIASFEEQE